jgi:hypothetical protein
MLLRTHANLRLTPSAFISLKGWRHLYLHERSARVSSHLLAVVCRVLDLELRLPKRPQLSLTGVMDVPCGPKGIPNPHRLASCLQRLAQSGLTCSCLGTSFLARTLQLGLAHPQRMLQLLETMGFCLVPACSRYQRLPTRCDLKFERKQLLTQLRSQRSGCALSVQSNRLLESRCLLLERELLAELLTLPMEFVV